MFFFGYSVIKAPYCVASVADASGKLILDRPISIPHPVMVSVASVLDPLS